MPTPHTNDIQLLKQMIQAAMTKLDKLTDELPRTYLTRADYEQRQESLEESVGKIGEKLDKLSGDLPNRFLDRLQYVSAHAEITKRVEVNEGRVEELRRDVASNDKRVTDIFTTGMSWANKTFAEMRELINTRSDTQDQKLNQIQLEQYQRRDNTQTQIRIVMLSVFLGALLAFVSTIILHVMHIV